MATRIVAPLTGNIPNGSWTAVDLPIAGVTLASGRPMHFEYLLPAQWSTNFLYPIMFWLHPDGEGDEHWYLNTNAAPLSTTDADRLFNNSSFRANYPSICVVPYADQTNGNGTLGSATTDGNDAVLNWGGWVPTGATGSGTVYSGDTGPNVFALINGVLPYIIANFSGDPNRVYLNGFSLGGIGAQYLMLKYNQINGSRKLFTSATSTGGVLEIHGFGAGPISADATTMHDVPVWWVSGGNDGTSIPSHWNLPMFTLLAGNSNYPAPGTSATQAQAGSSQMRFWLDPNIGHQETNSAGAEYPTNSTILNFLYAQVGNVVPTPPTPPPPTPPPPTPPPPSPTPTATQSANDTVVIYPSGSVITDSNGNQWSITSQHYVAVNGAINKTPLTIVTPTSGGSVIDGAGHTYTMNTIGTINDNGALIAGSGGTSQITVVGGLLWAQDSASSNWFTYSAGIFTAKTPLTPSGANNTVEIAYVSGNAGASYNVWELTTANLWYFASSPTSGWLPTNGTLTSPLPAILPQTIHINAIPSTNANVSFTVAGSLANFPSGVPILKYSDDNKVLTALPAGNVVSNTSFSFPHSGVLQGNHTLLIANAANPTINNSINYTIAAANTINIAPPQSANLTVVIYPSTGQIVDASGHIWSISNTQSVVIDGIVDTTSGSVAEIAYISSPVSNVPTQAANVGYNVQTFGPNITLGTTASPTTSYPQFINGANWVPFTFFGTSWKNIGAIQNSDGSVTLDGTGETFGNGLSTASAGNPSAGATWAGTAFGGGGYFEATMAGTGPMSFWANDIETMNGVSIGTGPNQWPGQAAGYGNWMETDFAEFDSTGVYGFAMHNWYGIVGSSVGTSTLGSGSPASPLGADYTQPNKYGFLWVPATNTTQGFAKWYFNGVQVGNTITWNKYNPLLAPPPVDLGTGGSSAYSVLDTLHLALILGGQTGGGSVNTIYNVQVWQASAANNITTLPTTISNIWYENTQNLWFYKRIPSDQWLPVGGTLINPLPANTATISLNVIVANSNSSFLVSGFTNGNLTPPLLEFSDNGNTFVILTGNTANILSANVTNTSFSFMHPKMPAGVQNIFIANVNNLSVNTGIIQYIVTGPISNTTGPRLWSDSPGGDGTYWTQPICANAKWSSPSDAMTVDLRHSSTVNAANSGTSISVGQASDPLITFTSTSPAGSQRDPQLSAQIHVPSGTTYSNFVPVPPPTPPPTVPPPTTPPPTPPPTTVGTGSFITQNGQILDPSGNAFLPIGVNIGDQRPGVDLANAVTNFTTGAPLTTLFPGINFIRIAIYSYKDPTFYDPYINCLTALGIVCELEHHVRSDGGTGGGGLGVIFTGQLLTDESNNYAALALHFKNNPYVWFGTNNEPPALTGLSQWQQATYNAIRDQKNQNPILLEVWGSRPPGYGGTTMQAGMVQSIYSAMHNVIWDPHQYGFINNNSTNQAVNNQTSKDIIAAAQTITSGDGIVPVIIAEYGVSTTGSVADANGLQNVTAVLQSGVGSAAWHWGVQDTFNNLNSGNTLTSYGVQVAAAIAAAAANRGIPTTPPPPTSPPTTLTIITPTSGGSVTDASNHVYTMNSTGNFNDNGIPVNGSGGTAEITVFNGTLWAEDSASTTWFTYSGGIFTAQTGTPFSSSPPPPPTTPPASPPPTTGGSPLIVAPLTGVTPGTWQLVNFSGNGVSTNYLMLLPFGYSSANSYPLLVYLHENGYGNDGTGQFLLGITGTLAGSGEGADVWFNNTTFRTNWPCIVVCPLLIENLDNSGNTQNWGGWGGTNPQPAQLNVVTIVKNLITSLGNVYTKKIMVTGDSLGGIGTWEFMIQYNAYTGLTTGSRLFSAGWSESGGVLLYGNPPNTNVVTAMQNVPIFAIRGASDASTGPSWDPQMYSAYGGGTPATNYTSAVKAPNGNMWYVNDSGLGHDVWGKYRNLTASFGSTAPAISMYNWLFSFTGP